MNIVVNGQTHNSSHATVLALLEQLELTQGRFAVEINGMLVPKSKLATVLLSDGMQIEVVQAVGGG